MSEQVNKPVVRPSTNGVFPRVEGGASLNLGNGTVMEVCVIRRNDGLTVGVLGHGCEVFTTPPAWTLVSCRFRCSVGDARNLTDFISDQLGAASDRLGSYNAAFCSEAPALWGSQTIPAKDGEREMFRIVVAYCATDPTKTEECVAVWKDAIEDIKLVIQENIAASAPAKEPQSKADKWKAVQDAINESASRLREGKADSNDPDRAAARVIEGGGL